MTANLCAAIASFIVSLIFAASTIYVVRTIDREHKRRMDQHRRWVDSQLAPWTKPEDKKP